MSRMLSKMNLISVVQQLPKEDVETIQGYVEMIEKENQELKKQLEDKEKKYIPGEYAINEFIKEFDDNISLKNQQKEFIEYLEEEINNTTSRKEQLRNKKAILVLETRNRNYNTILQKYKEIIGGKDE